MCAGIIVLFVGCFIPCNVFREPSSVILKHWAGRTKNKCPKRFTFKNYETSLPHWSSVLLKSEHEDVHLVNLVCYDLVEVLDSGTLLNIGLVGVDATFYVCGNTAVRSGLKSRRNFWTPKGRMKFIVWLGFVKTKIYSPFTFVESMVCGNDYLDVTTIFEVS